MACTTNVSVDDLFGFLFVVVVEIFDSLLTIFVHFFYFFSIIFIITDEPKFWYFEIIIIMHKCIMTGAMVVIGNGTPMQPLVAMFLQLMFLLVVLKMAPYNDDLDDWSSFVCSFALTLTTLGGFLLMIPRQLTEDPVISVELLIDYFVDGHQWIVLCVRDACHWVRCISGQSDRRSVEEDTEEVEPQQQQPPNESASDDKWR